MIRTVTIATFLMACGSGLYLYQSKHEVQVLDRKIERTVRDTAALREQTRLLATEWTMLNDPNRLQHFANAYLGLKPIAPAQFTSLHDLDSRLPAPETTPRIDPLEVKPVATTGHAQDTLDSVVVGAAAPGPTASVAEALPLPPVPTAVVSVIDRKPLPVRLAAQAAASPPAHTMVSAEARQAAARQAAEAHASRLAEAHAAASRPADARPTELHSMAARVADSRAAEMRSTVARSVPVASFRSVTPADARPVPQGFAYAASPMAPKVAVAPAPAAVPVATGGSLLGMARTMAPARPVAMNTTFAN